ncbi:alginate export family protein [Hyphomicrobium sp.]|uniref:alginate export family protein n=1 Tax=Hyphomicrobium sp. TaxID=82 RepID=UPI003F6FC091
MLVTLVLAPYPAHAQDPMRLYGTGGLSVRAHIEAGVNAVAEQQLFWDLASVTTPPAIFEPNKNWLESYVKPGISFSAPLGNGLMAYGKLSAVTSGTRGFDAFESGDTAQTTFEEGYLGLRSADSGEPSVDFSVGPREFKAGTGMLLANGGTSGFERGALKLGPRKAWEFAALGRARSNAVSATAFYIDPNEVPSSNTFTEIAGADVRYDGSRGAFAGVTVAHVLDSSAPYPKAAPGGIGPPSLIANGRAGLSFINLYLRTNPFADGVLEPLFVGADFAYEWNPSVDLQAWGGRIQIGYTFAHTPWKPTLTYSYQTFSGDDPSTPELERFDPLYFEGTPSSWSTGSKSSMVFINSNVNAHQLSLSVTPTADDTLTLRYSSINANEMLSPLQFGQATRLVVVGDNAFLITGVTSPHLADDVFLEYIRKLNPNTYLTGGLSFSSPGPGIASIGDATPPTWTGGFVNVVVSF